MADVKRPDTAALSALVRRLPALVNDDPTTRRLGRRVRLGWLLAIDDLPHLIEVDDGRLGDVLVGERLMRSWRFAVRAPADAWFRFWQPMPEAGFHDVYAMTKTRAMAIEGDLQPWLANLRYFKQVLAAPRRLNGRFDHVAGA